MNGHVRKEGRQHTGERNEDERRIEKIKKGETTSKSTAWNEERSRGMKWKREEDTFVGRGGREEGGGGGGGRREGTSDPWAVINNSKE